MRDTKKLGTLGRFSGFSTSVCVENVLEAAAQDFLWLGPCCSRALQAPNDGSLVRFEMLKENAGGETTLSFLSFFCSGIRQRKNTRQKRIESQDKASAEIRGGIFPDKFLGEVCRGLFGGFWGSFSLEKTGGKNPKSHPQQIQTRIWELRGQKSTLQESGLDRVP